MSTTLYFFAIVCSILSNFPPVLALGLDSPLKLMWGLPFFYIFIVDDTTKLWNKKLIPFYSLIIGFSIYCIICEAVTGKPYLGVDFNNILISSLIAITSFAYWNSSFSEKKLEYLSWLLLLLGLLLGVYVYFEYLINSNIMDRVYAVKDKNSIGQIIFCCALIPLLALKNYNLKTKYFIYASVLILAAIVVMTKSRATILGIGFVLSYFMFFHGSLRIRFVYSITFATAVLFILLDNTLYDIVINGILLGGRNVENLNDVSSGRVILISNCLKGISDNFWFGNGVKYMDCMPIIMLYQYGFLGAMMVFSFLIYIGYYISRCTDRSSANLITFLLFWCFMINSLFEAQPPFGPGIKCFLLWVFIGLTMARPILSKNEREY